MGASAAKIIRAAQQHGFDGGGLRCTAEALRYQFFPMIIYWERHHFVVLEGIKGDTFYLNDPASGHVQLDYEEFKASYSNICLLFKPRPEFKPSGKMPLSPLQAALSFLRGNVIEFIYVTLVALLLTVPGLVFPFMIKFFIDDIMLDNFSSTTRTTLFMLAVMGIFLLSLLLTTIKQHTINRLGIKIWLVEGMRFIFHALRLPLNFFHQRYPGDIAFRSLTIELLGMLIGGAPTVSLLSAFLLLLYGTGLVIVSGKLALGVFAIISIYCFYLLSAGKRAEQRFIVAWQRDQQILWYWRIQHKVD